MNDQATSIIDIAAENEKKSTFDLKITPMLIISDTSTGCNSSLTGSEIRNYYSSTLNSNDESENTKKLVNSKCSKAANNISFNSEATVNIDSHQHLFLPLKGYDSAYGSSMESHSENVSPSVCSNDNDYCSTDDFEHNGGCDCNRLSITNKDSLSNFPISPVTPISNHETFQTNFETEVCNRLKLSENNTDPQKLSSSSTASLR